MLDKLRHALVGAPKSAGSHFVLLNHNPADAHAPGDVQLYRTPEAVCGDMHGDDVRRGGYLAVDSRGHMITFAAATAKDDPVMARVASVATHQSLAMRLLKHYLAGVARERPTLGVDADAVGRTDDMTALVAMIPPRDIWG